MDKTILTIAGSDTLAGGGLQADLKTFEQYGIFGLTAITCIAIVEDDQFSIQDISSELLEKQLATVETGVELSGIKIGLIHQVESIRTIQAFLKRHQHLPIVFDPVLAFKETETVYNQTYIDTLISQLFPLVSMITPNLKEAELLSNIRITSKHSMKKAAEALHSRGASSIVIKGGQRLAGEQAVDLYYDGKDFRFFNKPKLVSEKVNGAGCTFASSIASNLVLEKAPAEAIYISKEYVYRGIDRGILLKNGEGNVWYR
ncbi:hydroxymethylpyrimidine/phosphomethylpyrimidine kinase [Enterococcus florum]|uniref:pyridoxal kinase n=1 Tax=Enterococcus florum TaxID=2480627 RepID=A0A4V0WPF9_9ENTE|nr:bifunctional hydroxymethylpyrimidine kinase/phosphomethylpyrimidine kinase [Enterococcus florum]GCF93719.1 hydroxymethylpyrimidine/phosphomethylpyrimidine kinase [Enterococcus florum]